MQESYLKVLSRIVRSELYVCVQKNSTDPDFAKFSAVVASFKRGRRAFYPTLQEANDLIELYVDICEVGTEESGAAPFVSYIARVTGSTKAVKGIGMKEFAKLCENCRNFTESLGWTPFDVLTGTKEHSSHATAEDAQQIAAPPSSLDDNIAAVSEDEPAAPIQPTKEIPVPAEPTEILCKPISLQLPALEDVHIAEGSPKGTNYIDMFVLGKKTYFVAADHVESVLSFDKQFVADHEDFVAPMADTSKYRTQMTDMFAARKKLVFSCPADRVCTVAFDIETCFATSEAEQAATKKVPRAKDKNCHISILGIFVDHPSGAEERIAVCHVPKDCEDSADLAAIKAELVAAGIEVSFVASQKHFFLHMHRLVKRLEKTYWQIFMLSFNGSSSMRKGGWFQSGKKRNGIKRNGYDLPFILARSGLKESSIDAMFTSAYKGIANDFDHPCVQTSMINVFGPRVHFLDLCQHLCAKKELFEKLHVFKHKIKSRTMDAYAEGLGLAERKDDVDAGKIGNALRTMNMDESADYSYTKLVKYCVQDCVVTAAINRKIRYVADILSTAEFTGLPIATCAHRTDANLSATFVLRNINSGCERPVPLYSICDWEKFVKACRKDGMNDETIAEMFAQRNCRFTLDEVIKPKPSAEGGFNLKRTRAVEVSETVLCGDFASLYPSMIRANKVTPFNDLGMVTSRPEYDPAVIAIENDPTCTHEAEFAAPPFTEEPRNELEYKFPIGDKHLSAGPSWRLFRADNEPNSAAGIMLQTIQNLFAKRKEYKDCCKEAGNAGNTALFAQYNSLQNAVKLIMNSMYGGLGSRSSQLYYRGIASIVAMLGRKAHFAMFKALNTIPFHGVAGGPVAQSKYGDTDSEYFACSAIPRIRPDDKRTAAAFATGPDMDKKISVADFIKIAEAYVARVTTSVRETLSLENPNIDASGITVVFEKDKIMKAALFPLAKKCYVYLCCNENGSGTHLESSGLQFGQLSAYCEAVTNEILLTVMNDLAHTDEILARFFAREWDRVRPETIEDFSFLQKDSVNKVRLVKEKYPQYASIKRKLRIVPIITESRVKDECWAPAEEVKNNPSKYEIDVTRVIRLNYFRNLHRMWPQIEGIFAKLCCDRLGTKAGNTKPRVFKGKVVDDSLGDIVMHKETGCQGFSKRSTPKSVSIAKVIKALKHCSDNVCYHESNADLMRFTVDLDAQKTDSYRAETFDADCRLVIEKVTYLAGVQAGCVDLRACKGTKLSAHLVFGFIASRVHCKMIALRLKGLVPAVDTAIYEKNHSLRLPICCKIRANGETDDRRFIVNGGNKESTLGLISQCCMTYLYDATGKKLPEISSLYQLPPPIDEHEYGPFMTAMRATATDLPEIMPAEVVARVADICGDKPSDIECKRYIGENMAYYRCRSKVLGKPCPICGWTHTGEHLRVTHYRGCWECTCFALFTGRNPAKIEPIILLGEKRIEKVHDSIEENIERGIVAAETKWNALRPIPDAKFVKFELKGTLNFIRASLGSGKSKNLIEQFGRFKTILMLSPRRAFTDNMMTRIKAAGFVDYRDVESRDIDLIPGTRVIIQIDSLSRVKNVSVIDLLILDEVMGINSQLISTSSSSTIVAESYVRCVQDARCVCAMDGRLNSRTIQCIIDIRNGAAYPNGIFRVNHQSQPYLGQHFAVRVADPSTQANVPAAIADEMLNIAQNGAMVCFCAQVELAKYISRRFTEAGQGYKVLMYNGQDLDRATDDGRSMYSVKRDDLPHINERILEFQPRLLIYTSTITVGVDIMLEDYFKSEYHIMANIGDANAMIQAMRRVRYVDRVLDSHTLILSPMMTGQNRIRDVAQAINKYSPDVSRLGSLEMPSLSVQYLAQLEVQADTISRVWWAYILDALHHEGANFRKLDGWDKPTAKMPNPIARNISAELVDLVLTDEMCERFEEIASNEHKGKYGVVPEGLELGRKKYALMKRFGLTAAEINSFDLPCMWAALKIYKKKLDLSTGYEIKDEPSFAAKLARIRLVARVQYGDEVVNISAEEMNLIRAASPAVVEAHASSTADRMLADANAADAAAHDGISLEVMRSQDIVSEICVKQNMFMLVYKIISNSLICLGEHGSAVTLEQFNFARAEAAKLDPLVTANSMRYLMAVCGIEFRRITVHGADYWSVRGVRYATSDTSVICGNSILFNALKTHFGSADALIPFVATLPGAEQLATADWLVQAQAECKTHTAFGKRCYQLILGAHARFGATEAEQLHERINQYLWASPNVTAIEHGIFESCKSAGITKDVRERIYRRSSAASRRVQEEAAAKAVAIGPIDAGKFPSCEEAIAKIHEIVAADHRFELGDLYYALFGLGARLAELTKAEITLIDGVWSYSGVQKGYNCGKAMPFVSCVEPEIAVALLAKAKEFLLGYGSDIRAINMKLTRLMMTKYQSTMKDARKLGGELIARFIVARDGLPETSAVLDDLRFKIIHHRQSAGQVANTAAYKNVVN